MNTDFSELSIMQMSDSFFPTGLYTMSNGLETLFDEKQIQTVDQIEELINTIISYQLGPADCVALSNSYDFAKLNDIDKVIQCDKQLYSMKLVKESRDAMCRSGSQMIKCVRSFTNNKETYHHLSVIGGIQAKFLKSIKKCKYNIQILFY